MTHELLHVCGEKRLEACPHCVQRKVRMLEPGDCLQLVPGVYNRPITLIGLRGLRGSEITIRGCTPHDAWWQEIKPQREADSRLDAVLTTGIDAETFRSQANVAAHRKQAAGGFPGLYYMADEACLYLRDCQHVVIENLYFDNCWPTALYLDNCQDIDVSACQFRWGTFAIGATGHDTRHISVEDCRWQQNPGNDGRHWKTIPWFRIHGNIGEEDSPDNGVVDIVKDFRHFDGDFFVGWRIAGFVTIRRNLIEDAFNAIHFFNHKTNPSDLLSVNVLIEQNRFVRIRDNAVEPEDGAWNWIVRHNVLIDVYKWFSFQLQRSGYFYIYGNLGWHTEAPGPGNNRPDGVDADTHISGSVFKLDKIHQADGPTYVFHNSFHLRERIAKKRRLAGLQFFNNAITFCRSNFGDCQDKTTLFAESDEALAVPHDPTASDSEKYKAEKKRFTKDWAKLGIAFYSNIIHGPDNSDTLRMLGYFLGENSRDGDPGFVGPFTPEGTTEDSFGLNRGLRTASTANNASVSFELKMPGPQKIIERGKRNLGAYQDNGMLFELSQSFQWIDESAQ